jgi:predicted DNA-binding transcriptional regulator AlpA
VAQEDQSKRAAIPSTSIEPLLTEKEVAKLLNVSVATVRRRRRAGQPPEWIKLNASVRYRRETVRRFIAAQERSLTSTDSDGKAVEL